MPPSASGPSTTTTTTTTTTKPGQLIGPSIGNAIARQRGLAMHGFVFAVVAIDLLVLNLITNRDTLWSLWPIGIWAIVLAAHAGASLIKPAAFGAHLFGGAATCIGLGIVNLFHGPTVWFIWPTLAWLVSLGLHAPFAFAHLRERRRSRP